MNCKLLLWICFLVRRNAPKTFISADFHPETFMSLFKCDVIVKYFWTPGHFAAYFFPRVFCFLLSDILWLEFFGARKVKKFTPIKAWERNIFSFPMKMLSSHFLKCNQVIKVRFELKSDKHFFLTLNIC